MKKFLGISALAGTILLNGVANAAPALPAERETVNQVALLQSLTLGHFDGSITVEELKKLGDIGIGTFEGLDGELIMLDGVVYRANQDLEINVVEDKVTIPFANVTFFEKDFSVKISDIKDKNLLEKVLGAYAVKNGVNNFYMVRLSADFNSITVRSEEGQKKPYPTLVQALEATQQEKTFENVKGTIVGLYCPSYMSGLNTAGWHFHFISDDKTFGGHVLDVDIKNGNAEFDKTANFNMKLPDKKSFQTLNLAQNLNEDIEKAEKAKDLNKKDKRFKNDKKSKIQDEKIETNDENLENPAENSDADDTEIETDEE